MSTESALSMRASILVVFHINDIYAYLCSVSRSDAKWGRCTAINGMFKGRLDT